MLILTRKPGESLYIGDDIKITIVEIKGHQIRVGIDAPKEFRIYREEIYLAILEENKQAAEGAATGSEMESLAGPTHAFKKGPEDAPSKAGRLRAGKLKGSLSVGNPKEGSGAGAEPQVVVKRKKNTDDE